MYDQSKGVARIRIGTRGSKLALAQAEELRSRLANVDETLAEPNAIEIVVITTTGDVVRDRPLSEIGGKGLFMKEIEVALIDGRVDLALHSMKDVETFLTEGTEISCILPREDPRDAFLSNKADSLATLPLHAEVGTSSVRRAALIKNRRPDIKPVMFRGNVGTRLRKLDEGEVAATLLAIAGMKRLGLEDRATRIMDLEEMPPAVAQGAIGTQTRIADGGNDARLLDWLAKIDHVDSHLQIKAERAMLATLDGTCHTPIAGYAKLDGAGGMTLTGHVVSLDGARLHTARGHGAISDAIAIGQHVGEQLLARAGPDLPH
ncbi:MAG: hydroxymethylbilane synthase [Rhodospirillaceae bacterium]|nr:hydroxymethylbilane synthase [Rhodospirillaceae bacterium]